MGEKKYMVKKKNRQKKGKKDALARSHCATSSNIYSTGGLNLKLVELYIYLEWKDVFEANEQGVDSESRNSKTLQFQLIWRIYGVENFDKDYKLALRENASLGEKMLLAFL